jgi:undecaprenyl-diphosphatase
MTWWQGVILGLVQGLTEFLPVSSSGHLVLAQATIDVAIPGVMVEVVLHVATLLAVAIVYRRTLWRLVRNGIVGDRAALRYIMLLVVATIPAAVIGLAFKDFFERAFDSLILVGINLIVTGALLWSTRKRAKGGTEQPGVRSAGIIGVAQALAILPGISRSGTTVSAGLWLGLDPASAAEFSFLMAMPAIAGAAILQIPEMQGGLSSVGAGPLALSFFAALISGIFAIRFLVALLRRGAFFRFAPYCWVVGAITVVGGLIAR